MSLNWSSTNVKNWDELKETEFFDNKLEIVVFDLMNCGIQKITHTNYSELYRRQIFLRYSRYGYQGAKDFTEFVSLEFVESLIGLSSNASNKTVTQFNKDILGELEWRTKQVIDDHKISEGHKKN